MASLGRRRRPPDIWPGFVDALAALLMVLVFLLLLRTLGQLFLADTVFRRDEAIARLHREVDQLAEMLAVERSETKELRSEVAGLRSDLGESEAERKRLASQLEVARDELGAARETAERRAARIGELEEHVAGLETRRDELQAEVDRLTSSVREARARAEQEQARATEAESDVDRLTREVTALRDKLARVSNALELSEAKVEEQKKTIEDLGARLNEALVRKVEELAKHRSEFFGKLREALGNRPDLRVVGDRFVFQSDLLFDEASADLDGEAKRKVREIVETLREIAPKIPDDLDWILRIDGHTDQRDIQTEEFPSNWELSTARALAIVRHMIRLDVPARRLAATGFGEHHPVDPRNTPEAWAKNRRIEIKLTHR